MVRFCQGEKNFYERFMQQKPMFKGKEDFQCQNCPHYRPDWKYRFCCYVECPYISDFKTFREE